MPDFGTDISVTLRTVALPFPDGTTQAVTAIQPALDFRMVSGNTNVAESLIRRLTTDRGRLLDVFIPTTSANYGTNIGDKIFADMTAEDIGTLSASIDAECRKDTRVSISQTAVNFAAGVLIITINIVTALGPFALVLAVNTVSNDVTVLSKP